MVIQKVNTQPFLLKSIHNNMCLYTKQICPIKARKDIVCYKVVKRRKHATGEKKYRTPCMKKSIKLPATISADPPTTNWDKMWDKVRVTTLYLGNGEYKAFNEINGGWIHACNTLDDAKLWLKKNYHLFNHNKKQPFHWAIIKCVVHKGVLYYRSYDKHTLCAKELFTRKVVLQG